MTFVRLPLLPLVTSAEVDDFRGRVARDLFWKAIEARKDQPLPARHPVPKYLRVWPVDANGSPLDFEDLPV